MNFERVAILDWSAAATPGRGANSIWLGQAAGADITAENIGTRRAAEDRLAALVAQCLDRGERLLLGVDASLGFPRGFAQSLTGVPSARAVWAWLAERLIDDASNRHNLRQVAAEANARFVGDGPFWGNGTREAVPGLSRRKPALPDSLAEFRETELAARGNGSNPKSCWQLAGAGAVGAQSLTLLPVLHRLARRFAGDLAVWPFDAADAPVVVAEVYPSMLKAEVTALRAHTPATVPDEAQVRVMAEAILRLSEQDRLAPLFAPDAATATLKEEGWILGTGHALALRRALPATQAPPRLRDDCFAMPQGVEWVPVDEALDRLRAILRPVTGTETCATGQATGRVLASDCLARRSNPPSANAAVDGYGFAHAATGSGLQRLPLVAGRAAAGQPFEGAVPHGAAVRILTGAILPDGVDCVVMEEDTSTDAAAVVFDGPVKPRANTRDAGEDVAAGTQALSARRRLKAPDVALLSALGVAELTVHRPLRVGVLSTGDEILPTPDMPAEPHQIWDANRPMLLALAAGWGYVPVDLGHVRDDPALIEARLNAAAERADVIFTSGGASAGDEDHVSALLRQSGTLSSWRVALKPGRPLALAMWQGTPVIGLPGNPVAAMVCAVIFGRPALSLLAGAGWIEPEAFTVPAAFSKSKKPGRREYLRARLTADGAAEVFDSEGSGRISGLSWATGLVELPDGAFDVTPGTQVRYLPYSGFGI